MKKITVLLGLLMLIPSVLAVDVLDVYTAECNNKGSIEVKFYITQEDYKVSIDSMNLKINDVLFEGNWSNDRYLKKGEDSSKENAIAIYPEGTFSKNQMYTGILKYTQESLEGATKGNKEEKTLSFYVDCPGLQFTCENLGLEVKSCVNTLNGFEADLVMKGMEQSPAFNIDPKEDIKYYFKAELPYEQVNGANTKQGDLPKQYTLKRVSEGNYKLKFNIGTNKINEMYIQYKDFPVPCPESQYPAVRFYSHLACTSPENVVETEQPAAEEPVANEEVKEETTTETPEKKSPALIWVIVIILVALMIFIYFKQKRFQHKI
ncbi:MAG: hypothetical protein PHG05_04670 [Candidatus Nanoarchaeia archaeon]|nr:hypothetical protein [Candidatus Nanoarchaeia archaeon]